MASSSLLITLPLIRASLTGLVRRRGWRRRSKGVTWSSKAEAKLLTLPPFVVRLRLASPAIDQTDINSVSEAATNWELVLGIIVTLQIQYHLVGFNMLVILKYQRYTVKGILPSRFHMKMILGVNSNLDTLPWICYFRINLP